MDKYELIEHIGKGSFGVVSKIKRKADGKILVWFLLIFYKKLKILNFLNLIYSDKNLILNYR